MPRKLLSLYVRVGIGAARLALKATAQAFDVAARAAGFGRAPSASPEPAPDAEPQRPPEPARVPAEPQPPEIDYDAEPVTPLRPVEERAKSIDDEPELVEELAESGVEEGAGAEIEVEEPWDGYDELHADDVIARIEEASAAELAVLELYERAHKNRRTVLGAAERRHKAISGPGARSSR